MYYDRINRAIQWLRQRPFIVFAILHAILLLAIFAVFDYNVGGNGLEHYIAQRIMNGDIPYQPSFPVEYPPLALLSFLLPALVSSSLAVYSLLFALQIYLLDLVMLYILYKLAGRLNLKIWYVLGAYSLCLAAVGTLVTGHFDMVPTALVMVALYAFMNGKNKTAWAFLALSLSVKMYPVIIAPLFALYLLRQKQYRRLVQGIAIFAFVLLLLNLPWAIINWDGYGNIDNDKSFLGYHMARGLHSESSYGSIILLGQTMGMTQVGAGLTYGSWNIISPLADTLAKSSFYITAVFLLSAYGLYARRLWQKPKDEGGGVVLNNEAIRQLLLFSLLVVLIMLLASKVFSPQYLIWICPLIPLVMERKLYDLLILFLVAAGISQYIYPHHYVDFERATYGPQYGYQYLVVLLFIRNMLMLLMAVPLYVMAFRSPSLKEVTPSGTT
ncbi:glycosyltransferase 87 family protein [Chloroflexota bacterium]